MAWMGNQFDDIQGDTFMFSQSLWQRTMIGESQFYSFEALFLPKSIKELFTFSYHAYLTNDCLNPAIEKLAEYPITEFLFTPLTETRPADPDYQDEFKSKESTVKAWRDLFDIQLMAKGFAVKLAMNFLIYGNAFVQVYQPFDRILICGNKQCRQQYMVGKAPYTWDRLKLQFILKCRGCQHKGPARVMDRPTRDVRRIHLMSLYPGNIDIDFNPYSGEREIYYNIPQSEIDKIVAGNPLRLSTTPWEVFEAIRVGRNRKDGPKLKLNRQNTFHLARHTVDMPGAESPWGMPITVAALRSIFYINMMRRAQTALMMDHILPFRWLFPAADNGMNSTVGVVDLADWRMRMRQEVKRWKRDPLYIMLTPVPVGQGQMGGDGKALMLFPEMEQVRQDIINAVNVPLEFVRGGLQYTGTSVSLRMLENSLMNQVEQIEKCFRWIVKRISQIAGLEEVRVDLKRFKMADDIQQRTLFFQMWAAQAISGQLLGQTMDFDFMDELRQRNAENIEAALGGARAQAQAANKMMSLQNLLAQSLSPDQQITQPLLDPMVVDQVYQGIGQMPEEDQAFYVQQIGAQNPDLARELQTRAMTDSKQYGQLMQTLLAMSPQNQQSFMEKLQQQDPARALILANLAKQFGIEGFLDAGSSGGSPPPQPAVPPSMQLKMIEAQPRTAAGMAGMPDAPPPGMPEQRPPRRQGGSPM